MIAHPLLVAGITTCLGLSLLLDGVPLMAAGPGSSGTRAGSQDQRELEDRIRRYRDISEDETRSLQERSDALDDAIESREALIRSGMVDGSRWLATLHADQAEDLLLRRIEFPNSWSQHLFNARTGCPMLPGEVPLIIGRGLSEVARARSAAEAAMHELETEDHAGERDPGRVDRLRFERALRIPLLESIGLVLAGAIDEESTRKGIRQLEGLDPELVRLNGAGRIVRTWLIRGILLAGDGTRLQALVEDPDALDSNLERVRATGLLSGPRAAADLALEEFRACAVEKSYERLLLADLHARYREASGFDGPPTWQDGVAELWSEVLEDAGPGRGLIELAIAARLLDHAGPRDDRTMPLIAAWAVGRAELARRGRGESPDEDARRRLEQLVGEHQTSDHLEGRALSILFRLALQEGNRLEAARLGRTLYTRHPAMDEVDAGMVADLSEPWAINGHPEASELFEDALRTLLDRPDGLSPEASIPGRRQKNHLRLAAQLARSGRFAEALQRIDRMKPLTEPHACELLRVRTDCLIGLGREGEVPVPELLGMQERLKDDVRAYLRRFSVPGVGGAGIVLRRAGYRSSLELAESNLVLGFSTDGLAGVSEVADRSDLDADLRIPALLLRHRMKAAAEGDPDAESRDLRLAVELDRALAIPLLLEQLETTLAVVNESRDDGDAAGAEALLRAGVRPITELLAPEDVERGSLQERVTMARAFMLGGRADEGVAIWRRLRSEQPDAWVILEGLADALVRTNSEGALSEAMRIYLRLGQGDPGEFVPPETWWHAQAGQLLLLERVGRPGERIGTRIERLRLRDPEFGGTRFRGTFEGLQRRAYVDDEF